MAKTLDSQECICDCARPAMRIFRTLIGAAMVLLTLAAVAGGWAYFEWMTPVVPGKILDKQQRIVGGRHAAPGRYLSTSFTLQDETPESRYLYGSPTVTDVAVDAATYEAYDVGQQVRVKYLPFNPRFARLEGQPVLPNAAWMLAGAFLLLLATMMLVKRTRLGVALCAAVTGVVFFSSPGPPPAQAVLVSSVALAAVALMFAILRRGGAAQVLVVWSIAMVFVYGWPMMQNITASRKTATAEVRSLSVFSRPVGRTRRVLTLQEFDRVLAAFVPEGSQETAFMLDFVDHGSVPNLTEGSRVTVSYVADRPEQAALTGASRTHYWKNAAVPLGAVVGVAWLSLRSKKSRKTPASPRATPARA